MASLTSLPTEVFEFIAAAVETADIPRLRLVSRETEQKSLEAFKERCLETLHAHLDKEALRSAINIATHALFGPAIKTLRICVDFLSGPPLCDGRSRCYCKLRSNALQSLLTTGTETNGLLASLLAHLKQLGRIRAIHTYNLHSCSNSTRWHAQILEEDKVQRRQSCFNQRQQGLFDMFIDVFSQIRLMINDLEICTPSRGVNSTNCHRRLLDIGITNLTLRISHHDNFHVDDFFKGIAALPTLGTLSITGHVKGGESSYISGLRTKYILFQRYQPRLISFHMQTDHIWYYDLQRFLKRRARRASGLRKLHIESQKILFLCQSERDSYGADLLAHFKSLVTDMDIDLRYREIEVQLPEV